MYHLLFLAAVVGQATVHPTGHLIIVGGGPMAPQITRKALEIAGGKQARILIIPQASLLADAGARSEAMWRQAGASQIRILNPADHDAALAAIHQADLIWMPGGDQTLLMSILRKHDLIAAIQQRFHEGATIGGTSAGAAVMSMSMLTAASRVDRVTGGTGHMAQGLGLWPDVIVDQHYLRRCRFNRLLSAVLNHPNKVGIGIDESTAVVVTGRSFEVIGRSNVMVIDARHTLELPVRLGEPEGAANVALHLLREGMRFNLDKGLLPQPARQLLAHNSNSVTPLAASAGKLTGSKPKLVPTNHTRPPVAGLRSMLP